MVTSGLILIVERVVHDVADMRLLISAAEVAEASRIISSRQVAHIIHEAHITIVKDSHTMSSLALPPCCPPHRRVSAMYDLFHLARGDRLDDPTQDASGRSLAMQ